MNFSAALQELLPSHFEFVFLDGTTSCDAAPGVADIYPAPYICWYKTPTTENVAKARKFVLSFVEENGPFDIIMGFSQGAALSASILLHHQIETPDKRAPFKAAIFFGSPVPFSSSLDHGIDARYYFGIPAPVPNPAIPEWLITDKAYLGGESFADISKVRYQMFYQEVDAVRISIPTAHIYGRKDMWRLHSIELLGLCDRKSAAVFEHHGGHEIPDDSIEDICDVIESVVAKIS